MRFEVPQFIEIEDKIFGPFTWKQFVYLGGGVGMGVVMYLIMPTVIFILLGLPLAGLALLLAFYPINNRPFSVFLESIFTFYRSHRKYYWRKRSAGVYRQTKPAPTVPTPSPLPDEAVPESGLNSLARKLEMEALQKNN